MHYIDIKNLDNFKKIIKKFLITTFLKKRNSNNLQKSKFSKNSRTSSSSIQNVTVKRITFENTNMDKDTKKIFKSLSFNLSEGDDIN
jgi:hypothetical protein